MPLFFTFRSSHLFTALLGVISPLLMQGVGSPEGAPLQSSITLLKSSAHLKPLSTLHIKAPLHGTFTLVAPNGDIAKGDLIGRYDDRALSAKLSTAILRLRLAQLQETEFRADLPKRRHEAEIAITELESRQSLLQTLQKNPQLREDLPESIRTTLRTDNLQTVAAQLTAARQRLDRMRESDYAEDSSARLLVLESSQTVDELQKQLAQTNLLAPSDGSFQCASLFQATSETLLSTGQEIGMIRNHRQLLAVIAANSPYLARTNLTNTTLTLQGPGGIRYTARFRESTTERTPISAESRVCWYEFSEADSAALRSMALSNAFATIMMHTDEPVAEVNKLEAARAHPGAFASGWAEGAALLWPDWELVQEGETTLGLKKRSP